MALTAVAAHASATLPAPDSSLLNAFTAKTLPDGSTPPSVAAQVGTEQLTGRQFAEDVAVATAANSTRHLGLTDQAVRRAVIDEFIRHASLDERAKAEHVVVSDAELDAYIRNQRTLQEAEIGGPNGGAIAASYTSYGGPNVDSYFSNPRVREGYRAIEVRSKLVRSHIGPNGSQSDAESFIQQTIAASHPTVLVAL